MKKRGKIGIGITVLVFSVMLGIASLPDEVLEESSFEKPPLQTSAVPESVKEYSPVEIQSAPEIAPVQEVGPPKSETIEPPLEIQSNQAEPQISESNPNLIKIEISDGVGTGDI